MFDIPEEKQPSLQGSTAYVMPDISSQTGVAGFSLGPISTIEETSMVSNDSFDISVHHSDPSESANSSEGSFLAELQQGNAASGMLFGVSNLTGPNARGHLRLLDSDDADDDGDADDDYDDDSDLDENDGEDDAVTMELTGTVNMGAYRSGDESSIVHGTGELGHSNQDIGTSNHGMPFVGASDAESFLNMLLQGNTAAHDTSLLDNILSQYEPTQQLHTLNRTAQSVTDTDYTRVGIAMDVDDNEVRDVTMYASLSEQAVANGFALFGQGPAPPFDDENMEDDDDEEEGGDGYEDAVTMDLTGIIARPPPSPAHQMAASEPEGGNNTVLSNVLKPALRSTPQRTPSLPRTGAIGSVAASIHSTPLRTPQRGAQLSTPTSLAEMLETLIASNPSAAFGFQSNFRFLLQQALGIHHSDSRQELFAREED
ncbi:hypothetical protein IWW37_002966 [Coemansia sp. RSA 2050]|nr:hypothetical protein IWW37_002966 [Coemansia sp. RSA 2050]KAJ2732540.1 hypothetical protein IW152_003747 [Coemansia sp. BCRC 34962]